MARVTRFALALVFMLSASPALASAAGFTARGSAEQVYALGLRPGERTVLLGPRGHRLADRPADAQGGVVFRGVRPGRGYRVRRALGARSAPVTVLSNRSAPPSQRIYGQRIPTRGYGYLSTRDGTQLAIDVHLPSSGARAPYPTLIEYAGYGYADPAGPQNGISAIANLLGFAVVDVNMRGTGCSGGAYNYFEPLQGLDGYDVIETVARQPWVLHHRVGMMGISFGGISQLFVAATQPPSLAAITPLSVIDNSATTLYAGGILNTGFAVAWAKERVHDALPASATGGEAYALKQIQRGDATCRRNQALHGEALNLVAQIRANRYYHPAVADPLSPVTFVHRIRVPVYLACQFTDEQTGGHCPDLAEHFTGTAHKWFTFTNGTHIDSLDPQTFNRWYDFLELYVARRAPALPAAVRAEAPVIYQTAMGVSGVQLPPDPLQGLHTLAAAQAAFQRLSPIRVLFDNGAGSATPLSPVPTFEQSFARFPIPGTAARAWYLGAEGVLGDQAALGAGADLFTWNARATALTDFTGDTSGGPNGLWTTTPAYRWSPGAPGSAVAYITAPLNRSTVVVGAGSVRAWVRSSSPDVDLQATLSEVRPDGSETFVQDGWVRASERRLDPRLSTPLEPVLSLRQQDAEPLPAGRFTLVTIPLYYEGHAFRAGSRIRVTISAPNGSQPIWSFAQTVPGLDSQATVQIAYSPKLRSALTLPVVSGVEVPAALPPCPGLRGEPCRPYQPFLNRVSAVVGKAPRRTLIFGASGGGVRSSRGV